VVERKAALLIDILEVYSTRAGVMRSWEVRGRDE
jgi:hypothetical protein